MSGFGNVGDEVLAAVQRARVELVGTPHEAALDAISDRLDGPLRVAIAGRVKAGKSTLLNALVGAHLAPTDASECTRIVTWYEHGSGYAVSASLRDGSTRSLPFVREDGALEVDLGGVAEDQINEIRVQWPASALETITLIDTPGLASINDENSRRTRDFLATDAEDPADADAVIYLMRHLHNSDVEFLDAFMDRSVSQSSPVNAVAVLSRADEIGAARLDAMESSTRIAQRYLADDLVKGLAATVVPVAGLLAETGQTLREDEAASLRSIADEPDDQREMMLMSVGQFLDIESGALTVDMRRQLLSRLGMFGVRLAVDEIRSGATTATELSTRLVATSGLQELRSVIAEHFLPRARTLQARTALTALRLLAQAVAPTHPHVSEFIDHDAERIEANAIEFARLRAAHLLATATIRLHDAERRELAQVLLGADAAASLGLPVGSEAQLIQEHAIAMIEKWRQRAGHPLADPIVVEICEAAARTGEAIYVSASA